MIIVPGQLGPVARAQGAQVPKNLSADTRFKEIMQTLQQDGLVANDASVPLAVLTAEQKAELQQRFDITDMAPAANKRVLLNELVRLGAISAQESELSGLQLLPPAMGDGIGSGLDFSELEKMLEDPNYISHLEKAIQFDEFWSRSEDVKDARIRLHGLLTDIFT